MNNDRDRDECTGYIEGRNAVSEALRAGRAVEKLFVAAESGDKSLNRIISTAKAAGAVISNCDRRRLDAMSATGAHQGVIAAVAQYEYKSVEDILAYAQIKGEKPLIVICDGLSDPHNLGAVIRSAEVAGAHGVIIPKHRSAGLTAITSKAAAGALEYIPVARVNNVTAAINELKEKGIWVFGADAEGERTLFQTDYTGACALVIGSEGEGMSRLVAESCDFIVKIPMAGKISSLNASAAAAVMLFEAVRQRSGGLNAR